MFYINKIGGTKLNFLTKVKKKFKVCIHGGSNYYKDFYQISLLSKLIIFFVLLDL